ncbi:MAG: tail fiber protein [Chthoniobacteraceae bacterium]
MSSPFLAEIRIFAGNFNPKGWALCNGQLLAISQNTALFSLLGTNYGGDGKSTFGLPNLQGSVPLGQGQGPGLSPYALGQSGGSSTVTLLTTELPIHLHTPPLCLNADPNPNPVLSPAGNVWGVAAARRGSATNTYATTKDATTMNAQALSLTGGGQPHNNLQPYLALTFIIALQGIYPPRS